MLKMRHIAICVSLLLLILPAGGIIHILGGSPAEPTAKPTKDPTEAPTESVVPGSVTQDELRTIEEYLNAEENNGFIHLNYYDSPTKIQLLEVFYNGAGIQIEKDQWADGEAEAVLKELGWSAFQYPPIKIPRKAADALLLEKCGLSLNNYWKDFTYGYVKAYDAYYYMHSREQLFPVAVVSGQIDENGHYIISYTSSYSCPPGDMYTSTKVVYSYIDDGIAYIGTRYDNVITGLCMYVFDTVYPAAESARLAPIFEEIIDSIVLHPY